MKIQYVIAIHLMKWLNNFHDFRFKWAATAGIRIHPTKAWLSHLARIEHEFLSGIRDSRMAGSLWEVMSDVGIVRKSIYQTWLAMIEVLREFRKRFLGKRPALFKSAQWHFHQDNIPVHNSILVTDYFTKMVIKTIPHPPYSPDLAPSDFWLFPELRGCRYKTIEEMKGAVTKVIDTLTQEDFHGAFQMFFGTIQQVHWSRRILLRRVLEFLQCIINKSAHTKKVWKLIVCTSYLSTKTRIPKFLNTCTC